MSFISLIGPRPASHACERFEPEAQATGCWKNRLIQREGIPFDLVLGSLETSAVSFPSRVAQNPDCGFVAMGVQYVMHGHNSESSQYVGPRILHGKGKHGSHQSKGKHGSHQSIGKVIHELKEEEHDLGKEEHKLKKKEEKLEKKEEKLGEKAKRLERRGEDVRAHEVKKEKKDAKEQKHQVREEAREAGKEKHHVEREIREIERSQPQPSLPIPSRPRPVIGGVIEFVRGPEGSGVHIVIGGHS